MLCQTCESIDFDQLIPTEADLEAGIVSGTEYHEHVANLVAAAESGCEVCAAIEKSMAVIIKQAVLRERLWSKPTYMKMRRKGREYIGYQGCSTLWVYCLGKIIAQLEIYIPEVSVLANPGMNLISGRPISSNPASEECLSLAKTWIHDCLNSQEHSFCLKANRPQISASSQKLHPAELKPPTRLIDVGPSDNSQEPKLIISSASQLLPNINYVALSHCWGQTQLPRIPVNDTRIDLEAWIDDQRTLAKIERRPLTTTTKTLEQRMQQIPVSTLPRTFQDAIKITRGLGLRYVWIDSLCIIQDSKSDWEKEAARMADVYKNSYVTVAAESSRDSHEGMFHERIFDFEPIKLPFHSKIRKIRDVVYLRPALDDWETCVNGPRSALRSRAWVLQESLLAPRTIHIGSQQMFWECRSRSLAEGNVTPISPSKQHEKRWHWSQNKRFLAETEDMIKIPRSVESNDLDESEILYLQWSSIIQDYSYRKLSYLMDIFPALEGLARDFNRRLNDKYIAGLWRRDLLRGLLWQVEESKPGELAREASPYRAPSWSWASIIGGTIRDAGYCVHRVGDYHVDIMDVHIRPTGDTPWTLDNDDNYYSAIAAGTLTLRGRWTSCSRWPLFEEKYDEPFCRIIRDTEDGFGSMFRYLDCVMEESYEAMHNNGRNLSLLEIAAWVQNPGEHPVVHFLILQSGNHGDEAVFKRVGVVALHTETSDLDSHERWVRDWEIKEVTIV